MKPLLPTLAGSGRRLAWAAGLVLLLWLGGCATRLALPGGAGLADAGTVTPAQASTAWARVLDRFVDAQGEVDFAALAQDRADLDTLLRHVAATSHDGLAGWPAQMAWPRSWISTPRILCRCRPAA